LQDGKHGKAWGIAHKNGEFFIFQLGSFFWYSSYAHKLFDKCSKSVFLFIYFCFISYIVSYIKFS